MAGLILAVLAQPIGQQLWLAVEAVSLVESDSLPNVFLRSGIIAANAALKALQPGK